MSLKTLRKKARAGKEQLHRIIELCRSIEERGLDPFLVEVNDVIPIIQRYFQEWQSMEEFSLDAEAINRLSSIIKLQSDWIKHRSTSLYTDPFLIEEKLHKLSRKSLAQLFLKVWHPIVEMEQISAYSLRQALKYWYHLLPLKERWIRITSAKTELGSTTRDELIEENIMAKKAFTEELEIFWQELKSRVRHGTKILYWDFIGDSTYEETVKRAYLMSFLVTYGYATLEVNRLEEKTFIIPFEKPRPSTVDKQVISIPISVSVEEWKQWKKSKND